MTEHREWCQRSGPDPDFMAPLSEYVCTCERRAAERRQYRFSGPCYRCGSYHAYQAACPALAGLRGPDRRKSDD